MDEKADIGNNIINYLLKGEDKVSDPVLIKWLEGDESNREVFVQYRKIWDKCRFYIEASAFNPDVAWLKINDIKYRKERYRTRFINAFYIVSGAAASILIFLVLSLFGFFDEKSNVMISMRADFGNRSEILLPDGSTVKLNSDSEITYSYDRKKKIREVSFHGEGFFNVAEGDKPFVVNMENGLMLKVLGTRFNLQTYPEDRITKTSLVEGVVELSYENRTLKMMAGDVVAFDKEASRFKHLDDVLTHTYGWLDNKLYMNNMSLNDVCKHLERWYDVEISISPELGESIHYDGVMQEKTITDVMNALSSLSEINYSMKGKNISITSK